jgi:signal transduction histidine kinase/CheY-like chemotaxis protein
MTRSRVLVYVAIVDLAALALFLSFLRHAPPDSWVGTLLLATLVVLAAATPVRLPRMRTTISATDPFVFTALAAYGALPACVVALAGIGGSTLGRERTLHVRHLLFNAGNVTLSTALAALAFLGTHGVSGGSPSQLVGPLLAAASVYFLTNTGLVTGAIVLDRGGRFLPTWRSSALWSAVSAYGGLTLSAGLLWVLDVVGTTGLALGVPPCWLLSAYYRGQRERQLEDERRIAEVQVQKQALEDKVAERTSELRQALVELEQANARLVQINERLTEANRAKSEFLARVSHELRTPLNAIIGFSELLRDPASRALNPEQCEFLSDIHSSGEHLLRLINEILDLSKIEAGKMELHRAPTDLPRALRDAAAMIRAQATQKGLMLEVEAETCARAALVDPGLFRQVLVNLLSNAVKFTPQGGSVRLVARVEEQDLIAEVRDTGIGIASADVPRVFEEFYQVDGSYARGYGGTGLGLALVRRMVELHGGTIAVETAPGLGSCFAVRFPRAIVETQAARAAEPASTEAAAERVRGTLLVVEDNALNRKLARNVLRARGHRVLEAATGEEALALLECEPVDLVLMDLQLPGMDGLEVTRRIAADPRLAGLPIVALTAHAFEEDERHARAAGCQGYIAKPIRLAEFPAQVEQFLGSGLGVRS